MSYLKKHSNLVFFLEVKVKTNSKNQNIVEDDDFLTISLTSKPVHNKANKELINLIKKKLKLSSNQIKIVSGLKTPNKILKISFLEKMEERKIIRLFTDEK